jgi:hypothetical protein
MNISKAVVDNITPSIEELKRKRATAVAELHAMNMELARLETLAQLSECANANVPGWTVHD